MDNARIFISYSHRGDGPQWRAALLRSLHIFEQHRLLDVWEDGRIRVSSAWDDDIKHAIGSARLAVILVTNEALSSEYILNTEFPLLRERWRRDKLPVFPVICSECDWRAHDWLRAIQAPNGSNPLSQLSQAAQDNIFHHLAASIAEALSRVVLAESSEPDQPPTPDHVYLDKLPLTLNTGTCETTLIGREHELALLDLAFAQPSTAIVSLVAWGGVGKTLLVQQWLQRLQRRKWFGVQRVYAWSFGSQGAKEDRQASEDAFVGHALEWFGVQCAPSLSPWDKGRLLAEAVARDPTLLILDGLEPLQFPPGPMGGQLRAPAVHSLLRQLARKANDSQQRALALITSRERLSDLADFERRPSAMWGSELQIDLANLTNKAGAALLHHAGADRAGAAKIEPDDAELIAASREVDGHALTLKLLGRFLARAHKGDIRQRDLVSFDAADLQEQGRTTFKMLAAFENWFAKSGEFGQRQLSVLHLMGLFDGPVDSDCLEVLRAAPSIPGLTESLFSQHTDARTGKAPLAPVPQEEWNLTTSFLSDFGLLTIQTLGDSQRPLVDCHPLIRAHFADKLQRIRPAAWKEANYRLYHWFLDRSEVYPRTPEEMQPLYAAVRHACRSGRHEEAMVKIFRGRILREVENYSWKLLGLFESDLAALVDFFKTPWREPVDTINKFDRHFVLAIAGFHLTAMGRATEALQPTQSSLEAFTREGEWQACGVVSKNLSELHLLLGDIERALQHAQNAVEFATRHGDTLQMLDSQSCLANAQHHAGRLNEAETLFRQIEAMQASARPRYPLLYSQNGFCYSNLLLRRNDYECVITRSEATLKLAEEGWYGPLAMGMDHLSLGRALLLKWRRERTSELGLVEEHVQQALHYFRIYGTQSYVGLALLARAELRREQGMFEEARENLNDVFDVVGRGSMHLYEIQCRLEQVRLSLATGDRQRASEYLAIAREMAERSRSHLWDSELELLRTQAEV